MIEANASVVSNDGPLAMVETRRFSACGQCESGSGCGTSLLAGLFGRKASRIKVLNAIGAVPGDQVIVGLNESLLVRASILLYLIPLLSLIAMALACQWLAVYLGFNSTEPWAVGGGLLGLAAGLFWVKHRVRAEHGAVILRLAGNPPVELELP